MADDRGKRAEPRKALRNAHVEYAKQKGFVGRLFGSQTRKGLIVNLSKGGLAFRTVEDVRADTRLELSLVFPENKGECKVKAATRWVLQERRIGLENYTHIVGAKFVEFSPEAWTIVQRVLKAP